MHDPRSKTQRSHIRVFLFAEYQIVLDSLKHFINSNRDMAISACVKREVFDEPAVDAYGTESDVGVVYVSNREQIKLVSLLLRNNPDIRVVVVAEGTDLESQADALELGAVGIVHKDQNYKFLIEAIRQTYAGETWLNQVLLHRILGKDKGKTKKSNNYLSFSDADSLTSRELEVIQMIGEGLNNKALATRLNISEATVRHHLSSIYGKIGVDDRVNMLILAYQEGLLNYQS
jgi:DNA-binding NarL/FixJ family response regulator